MDITKCSNKECKIKDNCLRYLTKDSERQSYANFKCTKENNYENKLRVNKINKKVI